MPNEDDLVWTDAQLETFRQPSPNGPWWRLAILTLGVWVFERQNSVDLNLFLFVLSLILSFLFWFIVSSNLIFAWISFLVKTLSRSGQIIKLHTHFECYCLPRVCVFVCLFDSRLNGAVSWWWWMRHMNPYTDISSLFSGAHKFIHCSNVNRSVLGWQLQIKWNEKNAEEFY